MDAITMTKCDNCQLLFTAGSPQCPKCEQSTEPIKEVEFQRYRAIGYNFVGNLPPVDGKCPPDCTGATASDFCRFCDKTPPREYATSVTEKQLADEVDILSEGWRYRDFR